MSLRNSVGGVGDMDKKNDLGGVGDVGPQNFDMSQKVGVGQKQFLRFAPFHYIVSVTQIYFFVPDICLFAFLMFVSYSNWC